MKRKIIRIDEDKCNGCGNCITGCHEGALKLINGKAKLVKEDFCDGLGACIKECPTGALVIEEREAPAFDEKAVIETQTKIKAAAPLACGCPSSAIRFKPATNNKAAQAVSANTDFNVIQPEIQQWPLQLHLVSPAAPYFQNKELVVLSTCSPIASPDVNWKYLRGRAVVLACPKLDRTESYSEKLAAIFETANTSKVHIVMMEVPCCRGLKELVKEAVQISGMENITVEEHIVKIPL